MDRHPRPPRPSAPRRRRAVLVRRVVGLGALLLVLCVPTAAPAVAAEARASAGPGAPVQRSDPPPGAGPVTEPRATGPPAGGPPAATTARYGWPLRPVPRVAQRFREPSDRYAAGHRGVDLVGVPGQPVLAARGGTVAFAGPLAGRGVVSVLHADGLRTTYEPVTASVAVGTVVERGTPLGTLEAGHPGCPEPACLHWGVRRGEADYLDPLVLVGSGRVRLLPAPQRWPW